MRTLNVVDQVRTHLERLRRSERKVAELLLADPRRFVHLPIAAVAEEAEVSEPTVVRFCRAVGCDGFQDLRLRLAMSLGTGGKLPYVAEDISPSDTMGDVLAKCADHAMTALKEVRERVSAASIDAAVTALLQARRIHFYGSGSSGVVAVDAQHAFIRLDVPAIAFTDGHQRIMAAAGTGSGDVVLAFSSTGRSRDVVHAVRVAQASGATTIGVTRAGAPLASVCDVVIDVPLREDTDLYTPMVSRLSQLLVVDVLVTAFMIRRGEPFMDHLRRVKVSLGYFRDE